MIGSKPEEFDDIKYIRNNYVTMKTSSSNGDLDWSIKFDQVFYGEKKLEHIKPMLLNIYILILMEIFFINIKMI